MALDSGTAEHGPVGGLGASSATGHALMTGRVGFGGVDELQADAKPITSRTNRSKTAGDEQRYTFDET
jgi:hypothetical protein